MLVGVRHGDFDGLVDELCISKRTLSSPFCICGSFEDFILALFFFLFFYVCFVYSPLDTRSNIIAFAECVERVVCVFIGLRLVFNYCHWSGFNVIRNLIVSPIRVSGSGGPSQHPDFTCYTSDCFQVLNPSN